MSSRLTALVHWSARVFGNDIAARVFAPLVADWLHDVQQAPTRRRRTMAWVGGAASLAMCTAVVGVRLARPTRLDAPVLLSGILAAAGFAVTGGALLYLPFATWWANRGWAFVPIAVALLPTVVVLALPFALLPGAFTLAGRADGPTAWRARVALGVSTLLVTLTIAAAHAWVIPATSVRVQRLSLAGAPTTPEALNAPVLRLAALATLAQWGPLSAPEARRRAAMTFVWPVALATLGWRIGRHRRSARSATVIGWWLAAIVIGVAFQPVATPFRSLHPMLWWQTPEFSAAATWLAMALAFRPAYVRRLT